MSSRFDQVHPVLSCVASLRSALEVTAEVQAVFMAPADKRTALVELVGVEAQLAGLRLRLMAASDDVALDEGARDVAALVTHHTRTDPGTNRRDLALAQALDQRWLLLASALGQGEVNTAQAHVISHALDELPSVKVGPELMTQAEAHLVEQAGVFGPRELRHLGRRILDHIAPEIGEAHEAEQLAKEEREAESRSSLTSTRLGNGSTRITINVADSVAARLNTYLEAYTSPRHHGGGEGDRIPIARKRGQAFGALLEALDPRRVPAHGGDATTVIVTIPLEELRKDLGTAEIGLSDKLTAGEVRRLACTANHPAGRAGWEVRGPRPRPHLQAVQARPAQGDDPPRQAVPRPGLHHPRRVVRGPPLGQTLGQGRTDRPQGRGAVVHLAPPPRPRRHLRHEPDAQRRRAVQPTDLDPGAGQGVSTGSTEPSDRGSCQMVGAMR